MNIHSVMALNAVARRSDAPPGPKRDAILRAAIDVFAERGFFNAQVADVARAAGVAAGTVYLYFKSKDDLLVSIFERSMREGLAKGRAAVAQPCDPRARLLRLARAHLARLGQDRNLAIVFQVELRQSTKFMERCSATLLRDYLGLIREAIADGQREGLFRTDLKATVIAKMLFGALDEMATNWILSRRRYSLEPDADAVVDLIINGARARSSSHGPANSIGRGSRRRHDGRADRGAVRQCGCAGPSPGSHDGDRARGAEARHEDQAGSVLHARGDRAHRHRRVRQRSAEARWRRLDHGGGRRAARCQTSAPRARGCDTAGRDDCVLEHVRDSDRDARGRPQ